MYAGYEALRREQAGEQVPTGITLTLWVAREISEAYTSWLNVWEHERRCAHLLTEDDVHEWCEEHPRPERKALVIEADALISRFSGLRISSQADEVDGLPVGDLFGYEIPEYDPNEPDGRLRPRFLHHSVRTQDEIPF